MAEKKNSAAELPGPGRDAPRIAVIGCGAVAEKLYLPNLAKNPSVLEKLVLVDPNEERAQQIANEFNAGRCLSDYQDLLCEKVDGVIITAPTHWHHPIAMDFLSRGVHVLCEKPLAENAEKAVEMVACAEKNGVALLTNYHRRLHASYQKVKEMLAEQTFGKPLTISYYEGQKYSWPIVSGSRFNTKLSTRGVLLDRGAHVLDVVCWWLGGKPKLISSRNDSFGGCEAVAQIKFDHEGCRGDIKLSLLEKLPCEYRIECERGIIEGDIYDPRIIQLTDGSGSSKRVKLKSRERSFADFGETIVSNFLDIHKRGEKPLVSGADVLTSVKWIDECYEAVTRFEMPWYENLEGYNG